MGGTYENESYKSHEEHITKISGNSIQVTKKDSIDYWRHTRMYSQLLPLLTTREKWLTVGDGRGVDANWLINQGMDVVASDIGDSLLKKAQESKFILEYSKENAEKISFENNAFHYTLCKEAYHHFPRPYIAIYEMLRVSKKAIIFIEPIDVGIQMPVVIFIKNILDKISPSLIDKIWKNRYSFEPSGNYVYKTSKREFEKVAMGINLPYIAFKGFNDYYSDSLDLSQPLTNTSIFRKVKNRIWIKNFLSKTGLIPYQLLVSILFKDEPSPETIQSLEKNGYKVIKLKRNPYI